MLKLLQALDIAEENIQRSHAVNANHKM